MNAISVNIPTAALTPPQLAELFWALDSEQQAQFFNALGVCALATPAPFSREFNSWAGLDWQMYHAAKEHIALPYAQRVMDIIGTNADRARASIYPREEAMAKELYACGKLRKGESTCQTPQ